MYFAQRRNMLSRSTNYGHLTILFVNIVKKAYLDAGTVELITKLMKKLQKTDPVITHAMTFCAEKLSLATKDPDILLLRGIVYLTSNQPKNAVVDFTHVIEQVSINERAYFLRSKAYYELDDFDQALKDCIKAMREGDSQSYSYSNEQIEEMSSGKSDVKEVNSITNHELKKTLILLAGKFEDSTAVRDLFHFHLS